MLCKWQLWVNCKTERKSLKILNRFADAVGRQPLDVQIVRDEDGHRISFAVELESNNWNNAVVEAIALGQCIADRWNISSGITSANDQLAAGAQKIDVFRITGVEAALWEIDRNAAT